LLLAACAGNPSPPVETLEQRVQGRWDALLADDLEAAYQYFSPGLRQTVRFQDFVRNMASRTIQYTGAAVKEDASCDGDACKVEVVVAYAVRAPAGGGMFKSSSIVHENWIRTDGQWFFVPMEVL